MNFSVGRRVYSQGVPKKRREKPRIVVYPGRMGGQPTVGDSRIPAELVAGVCWAHGMDEAETQWEPYVDRDGVLLACWYMGRYGTRTWRKRMASWIEDADYALWHGEDESWDNCPDPPMREAATAAA